jgi:predicted GNAT family N-acyltransferase
MIEIRENNHISLFFVDVAMQNQGVGRALLEHALEEIKQSNPGVQQITVNSAPNAVEAYKHLGFRRSADEQTVNGITTIPMALDLAAKPAS